MAPQTFREVAFLKFQKVLTTCNAEAIRALKKYVVASLYEMNFLIFGGISHAINSRQSSGRGPAV
jgi:hypothetical protein